MSPISAIFSMSWCGSILTWVKATLPPTWKAWTTPISGKRMSVAAKPPPTTINTEGMSTNEAKDPPKAIATTTTRAPAAIPMIVARSIAPLRTAFPDPGPIIVGAA